MHKAFIACAIIWRAVKLQVFWYRLWYRRGPTNFKFCQPLYDI